MDIIKKAELSQQEEIKAIQKGGKEVNGEKDDSSPTKFLMEFVINTSRIFVDQFGEPCFSPNERPFVAYRFNSLYTRRLLAKYYWQQTKEPINKDAINTAISTLEGLASENEVLEVNNRIAWQDGNIYYDIGDNENVVEISNKGWKVIQNAPVLFKRFTHQEKQIIPVSGGNFKDILRYLNVENEQQKLLLLTFIIVSFVPNIPHSLLVLHGVQGSAKSTAMKILRSLIDPSNVALMAPPDNIRELIQQASHHYSYFLDNLSRISEWLSDCLCRMVTGEGFSKRVLYSDDDDYLYKFRRVVSINGINQVASRPDLLDRSIIIQFERITDSRRREETDLWNSFQQDKPKLFGALLDLLSKTLSISQSIKINKLPRMADYYRYSCASGITLGYSQNEVEKAFEQNNKSQDNQAIENSSTAQALMEFSKEMNNTWEGSSTQLYESLLRIADNLNLKSGFPKAASWLWRRIVEVKPNLLTYGIKIERFELAEGSVIRIQKDTANTATTATQVQSSLLTNGSNGNSGNIDVKETVLDQLQVGGTPYK